MKRSGKTFGLPKRRASWIRLFVTLLSFALVTETAQAQSFGRIRDRVRVINNSVVSAEGTPLRGGPIVLSRDTVEQTAWAENIVNMRRIRDSGLNVVRVICFDAYNATHGNQAWSVDELLPHLDTVVNNAAQEGLYVIINFHDVGGYSLDSSQFPLREFWQKVAPRYATRTHVLYETANEPAMWSASAYTPTILQDLKTVDDIIRAAAPDTHIIHLTISQLYDPLKPLADTYVASLNSFSSAKDSIGIHGYGTNSSATIVALKAAYPTIVTEWDYPFNQGPIQQIDGELYNGQTFERLGLSWMDWSAGKQDGGQFSFQEYVDTFRQDARTKGYSWLRDAFTFSTNVAPSAKNVTADSSLSQHEAFKGVDTYSSPYRKWASAGTGDKWLALDLGSTFDVNRWVVRHAGAGGELAIFNTRDFKLQKSLDGISWTDADVVSGNTLDVTDRGLTPVSARYFRLYITNPTNGSDNIARINDLELYCDTNCGPGLPPSSNTNFSIGSVVAVSSTYSSEYAGNAAVDGNSASGWSPEGNDQYPFIQIDLGVPRALNKVELVTRQDTDQPDSRRNLEIWASNNSNMGTGHDVLGTIGPNGIPHASTWTQLVSSAQQYRYVAIVKTSPGYLFVSELRVFGP